MASLAERFVKKSPPTSNHDWSYVLGTSMAAGPIYPLDVTEVNAGDSYLFNPEVEIQTQPLLKPVLGRMHLDLYMFYAPQSLYARALHSDVDLANLTPATPSGQSFLVYSFPTFRLYTDVGKTIQGTKGKTPVQVLNSLDDGPALFTPPTSLLGRLGFPPNYVESTSNSAQWGITKYNAMPLLLYLDICRSWFANRQYKGMPYLSTDSNSDLINISVASLSSLDKLFVNLTDGQDMFTAMSSLPDPLTSLAHSIFGSRRNYPSSGLFLSAYSPDINQTLLNSDTVNGNANFSVVSVEGGEFAMDTFVQAKKFWDFFNIVDLVSSKYTEFSRGVYNVKPDVHLTQPVFLGKRSIPIFFNQVRSTFGSADSPLGSLAGNGFASFNPRNKDSFRFSFSERGYFMVVGVIRPDIMYERTFNRAYLHTTLADAFYPQFNGLGYEDAYLSDIRGSISPAQFTTPTSSADATIKESALPSDIAIAKRPAFTQFRGRVDRLSGLASEGTGIRDWFLAAPSGYNDYAGSSTPVTSDRLMWHYCDPSIWNSLFALTNREAENFIVRIGFNWTVNSLVSKRVSPFLSLA